MRPLGQTFSVLKELQHNMKDALEHTSAKIDSLRFYYKAKMSTAINTINVLTSGSHKVYGCKHYFKKVP